MSLVKHSSTVTGALVSVTVTVVGELGRWKDLEVAKMLGHRGRPTLGRGSRCGRPSRLVGRRRKIVGRPPCTYHPPYFNLCKRENTLV